MHRRVGTNGLQGGGSAVVKSWGLPLGCVSEQQLPQHPFRKESEQLPCTECIQQTESVPGMVILFHLHLCAEWPKFNSGTHCSLKHNIATCF